MRIVIIDVILNVFVFIIIMITFIYMNILSYKAHIKDQAQVVLALT